MSTRADIDPITQDAEHDALLAVALDLSLSLSSAARYQRLVDAVRRVVPCDAAALLRYRGGVLEPLAVSGLAAAALGRTFAPGEHPRLAAILGSRTPVRFPADDPRPDPYDGLIEGKAGSRARVHACMGSPLYVGDELVGALTVDALAPGAFESVTDRVVATFAALAAAAVRTATLIETLERLAEKRGLVARQLIRDALERQGGELVGRSPAIQRLREELAVVARADLPVLISGETGTGKELVARTLHARSARADHPLVYVNCAALPESVAESELFGHTKGAFTGAVAERPGRFELADGGTLCLDEVGELPLSIQPKLLRALQYGELQRVGADSTVRVDVRVIAATNRDLAADVRTGRFRPDLFYRLGVYPIHVPPLREREGDIELLAGHFLDRARSKFGLEQAVLTPAARQRLESYAWPGNVRELEHVITRAALRALSGIRGGIVRVDTRHLALDDAPRVESAEPPSADRWSDVSRSLAEATLNFQRRLIADTVSRHQGNWAAAARSLGMHRSNLHRTARRLGLK